MCCYNKIMNLMVISLVVTLLFPFNLYGNDQNQSNKSSKGNLSCGSTFKIETHDGKQKQGTLLFNDSSFVVIQHGFASSKLDTIMYQDINSVFHLKRKTGYGVLAGSLFGLIVGTSAFMIWNSNHEPSCSPNSWFCLDIPIGEAVAFIAGGIMIGGFFGAAIGYNSKKYTPVKLELIPKCNLLFSNTEPLSVQLTLNF